MGVRGPNLIISPSSPPNESVKIVNNMKVVKKQKKWGTGKKSAKQPKLSDDSDITVLSDGICGYTDGGCQGNGQAINKGACAFVIVEDDQITHEYSRKLDNTTNNKCEMQAVADCVVYLEQTRPGQRATIYSDSQYVVKGLNIWRHSWIRKGFTGIANPEEWVQLDTITRRNPNISYKWVKSHSTNPYNNRCDELCTEKMTGVKGEDKPPKAYPKEWGTEPFIPKGFRVATEEEQRRLKGITEADDLLLLVYKERHNEPFSMCSHGLMANITEYLQSRSLIDKPIGHE